MSEHRKGRAASQEGWSSLPDICRAAVTPAATEREASVVVKDTFEKYFLFYCTIGMSLVVMCLESGTSGDQ